MAECVKVVIRARPLNKREKDLGRWQSNLFRNERVPEVRARPETGADIELGGHRQRPKEFHIRRCLRLELHPAGSL